MNQSREAIRERQHQLLNYIKSNRIIKVSEASKHLGVSELTIRRDLEVISNQHLIERFHGGARIKTPDLKYDIPVSEKETRHEAPKKCIAQKAAALIYNGDSVFLNSGSTTSLVMRYLDGKNIRVFTNNALAPSCIQSEHTELIITGGECRLRSKALIGTFASDMLKKVYTNACILGTNGISSANGITTSNYQEASINELMVTHCRGKIIVVADGSKIGQTHPFVSIGIRNIHILITDSSADKEELHKIQQCGIEVIVADT